MQHWRRDGKHTLHSLGTINSALNSHPLKQFFSHFCIDVWQHVTCLRDNRGTLRTVCFSANSPWQRLGADNITTHFHPMDQFSCQTNKKNQQIDKNGRASSVTGLVVEEIPEDVQMMVHFRFPHCLSQKGRQMDCEKGRTDGSQTDGSSANRP